MNAAATAPVSTQAEALARTHAWLETLRGPDPDSRGYGGPVSHWWRQCLAYTGPGLDWRYEGLLAGYSALWRATQDVYWLGVARRAATDLARGQRADGHYSASSFELNPYSGGTPHEAAASLGLLHLVRAMNEARQPGADDLLAVAQRNLDALIARLWDPTWRAFRDDPQAASFVPNKAATLCEALFLLADLTGDDRYSAQYALPTLAMVRAHQVNAHGRLHGSIVQVSFDGRWVPQHFPYYVARCIPALLEGYTRTGAQPLWQAAQDAGAFVLRHRDADGAFPQVLYPRGANRWPRWVAATGDVLRALRLLNTHGFGADLAPTERWLADGLLPHGGVRVAHGFAAHAHQRAPGPVPDLRDLLPVAGWADKAFRAMAEALPGGAVVLHAPQSIPNLDMPCLVQGQPAHYHESAEAVVVTDGNRQLYRWAKGDAWADIRDEALLWK